MFFLSLSKILSVSLFSLSLSLSLSTTSLCSKALSPYLSIHPRFKNRRGEERERLKKSFLAS